MLATGVSQSFENESVWTLENVVFGVTQAVDQILNRSVTPQLLFVIRVFQIQYSVQTSRLSSSVQEHTPSCFQQARNITSACMMKST